MPNSGVEAKDKAIPHPGNPAQATPLLNQYKQTTINKLLVVLDPLPQQ